MTKQNEVPSRCATCGSGIALRDGRAACAHNEQHGIAFGGPGSGWHASAGHVPGSQGGKLDGFSVSERASSPEEHKAAADYHAREADTSSHHAAAAKAHLRAAKDRSYAADARDASKAAHMHDSGDKLPSHDFYGRWKMKQVEDDGSYLTADASKADAHQAAGGKVQPLRGQDPSGQSRSFYHLKPANESTDMPAATADPFSAPPNAGRTDVRIVNNDSPNKAERLAVTKSHVKTLHAQLKREGFVRGLPQVSVSKPDKLGRSSAYGGGRRDTRTPYTHPDGRQALMRVGIPNAGPHTVSVIHGASDS